MKILHVIPSLSLKAGGPSIALPIIARSLVNEGVAVDVVTTDDDGPGAHLKLPLSQRIETDGYGVFRFRKQTEFYKFSFPLSRWLTQHVTDYDLLHIHALFSFTSTSAARAATKAKIPYVIRPLGVLNHWGMANRRRWLKQLSFRCLEEPILRRAAAMHYTSQAEQREAEASGATAPMAIIPLGIDTRDFQNLPGPDIFLKRFPKANGRALVLFLSRVDAKKGLDLLLPVFAEVRQKHPAALLVIAGSGAREYVDGLHEQASQLGLADDVVWTGFLSGADKLSALAATTVFMLPSYSENFGIALMEAMAAGLPCLTTTGVALAGEVQARSKDVLVVVPAELRSLAAALDQLLEDAALRGRLGAKAKQMVAEQFTVESMGFALKKLYESILAGR